jgi:[ribosomal protein S5]-alanine N-acetyltransferase
VDIDTRFQLAIVLRDTGQLIGNCGIRKESPDSRDAEIGYELNPEYWGRGYATEAAREILDFGFSELDLHKVSSWCVADNTASAHVLEKLGMRLEGRVREKEYYKDRWWDVLLYGILKREWDAIRNTGLKND